MGLGGNDTETNGVGLQMGDWLVNNSRFPEKSLTRNGEQNGGPSMGAARSFTEESNHRNWYPTQYVLSTSMIAVQVRTAG